MGGLAEYQSPTLPEQPSGIWGERPTISPTEGKELIPISPQIPTVSEAGINTLDFIFENLRRFNYASANTFDKLYDNLSLLKAEGDKGVGIPGILQVLKKGNWNLAESAWKGFTLEEKKTFSDLAEKAGIPFPKATGFVGDVALDPLTYIPASWFQKAFKIVGVGKLGKAFEKTPFGEAFIPGAGLPKEFYESKLFAKYGLKAEERKILDEIYELRKGLGKDAREHLTKIRSLGYDPIATMKEIDALVDEGKITIKDIDKLQKIGEKFDFIGQRSVDEGTINKAQFDTWKGSYWPGMAKEKAKLGSPDVVPNFFEKASKGGWFAKHKHFRDIDDFDDYLKSIGFKEGAERDILKLLAYREVTEARILAKKKFIDLTLEKFGEKIPAGSVKIPPEGSGLYLPKGAIRIFSKEYLEPDFINNLSDLAEKLKDLRLKTEKVTTTKIVTEAQFVGTKVGIDLPGGWKTEVVPTFRRTPGWKSEVDWKNKRIVFETAEDAKNIDIINHEIAHIKIEDKLGYIEKLSDSPFLEEYAKIRNEPKGTHINFIREHLAMDYGDYLTNPEKFKPELKNLIEKYLPKSPGAKISAPRAKMEGIVRDSLMRRGFTEGESNAYINVLSTKGKEGIDEVIKTMTEKTETVKAMLDSMPIEQGLIDIDALTEAQIKTMGAITKRVPTYLLPKEIANDLNKMNKFFIGDESTNWFLRHVIDKPLSVWKSMATAWRLPFHLRNFSSNMFLMFEGDVNPAMIPIRLSEAGSIQSGAVKELMIKGTKVDKELLNKFGILGGHGWIGEQSSAKFVDEIDSILKYGRAKNFNPMQYPREFGSFIESNSRIGLFIDQLNKGKTVEEAALHVKKYLFNYDELTQFERNVMKRIIPFYTWLRKNTPLQIEMLATKPGKLATAAKGLDALSGEETPGERKARPEYFDDMGYRKTPDFLDLRDDRGNPIYFNLDMPYNDLNMFDKDIGKIFGQLYGAMTPQKMALEIAMNVKAFPRITQIEKFKDQRVPAPSYIGVLAEQFSKIPMVGQEIIKQMGIEPIIDRNTGLKVLGMNAKWKYGIETAFPVLSEMGKMYPQPIKLEEENAPWRKWSYILGVKVIPLNIEMQNKMKQIEKMGKSKEFMQKLQNIGRTPTSQELNDFMKEMNK